MTITTMCIKDRKEWQNSPAYSKIICTRYFPRHLKMTKDQINKSKDLDWLPQLAPSIQLLREYKSGKIDWNKFEGRYNDEIYYGYDFLYYEEVRNRLNRTERDYYIQFTLIGKIYHDCVKGNKDCILLCWEPEEDPHCHRHLLKKIIEKHGEKAIFQHNVMKATYDLIKKGFIVIE